MPAKSYRAVSALHDKGWSKHGPLGYRVGTAQHNKTGVTLAWPNSTIISFDRGLFVTASELTNETSSILQ